MAFSSYKRGGNAEAINGKHKVDQLCGILSLIRLYVYSVQLHRCIVAEPTQFPSIAVWVRPRSDEGGAISATNGLAAVIVAVTFHLIDRVIWLRGAEAMGRNRLFFSRAMG